MGLVRQKRINDFICHIPKKDVREHLALIEQVGLISIFKRWEFTNKIYYQLQSAIHQQTPTPGRPLPSPAHLPA